MRFIESQQLPGWIRFGAVLFILYLFFTIVNVDDLGILLKILILFPLSILTVLIWWTLLTEIDSENIYIKAKPFLNKKIPFTDIESWTIRTYRPIMEYGGWGIRFSRKGTAYNVSGNKGLQLALNSGKNILIGTQKPDGIRRILKSIIPEKELSNQT